MSNDPVHVLVWSEATAPEAIYPNGINATVAEHLNEYDDIIARTTSINDAKQGTGDDLLAWADTLVWWAHLRHDDITDDTVDRIEQHVMEEGLGFIALHSAHYARPFTRLIDDSGDLSEVRTIEGEREHIEIVAPDHPIAKGVEDFTLSQVEMFGEPFSIPEPERVVLRSTFTEGGAFRSGITFSFGAGRGFYLRPGHEEFRIYHYPPIRTIMANAARWVAGK